MNRPRGRCHLIGRLLLTGALLVGGCFNRVEERCASCTLVDEWRPRAAPVRAGARRLVVLVPGALGFGDEWDPVLPRLRALGVDFFVFWWRGPFTDMSRVAVRLTQTLDATLAAAPPSLAEVLVIGHSAGGLMVQAAAHRIDARGRRVRIVSIAAPGDVDLSPWTPDESVNTPLGFAVGGTQAKLPPIAPGVELTIYETLDPPRARDPADRRVYLGARVGHNESVGLVALPLLDAFAR
jgi:pimeloyl-ACP methyl ester carboxylesterase